MRRKFLAPLLLAALVSGCGATALRIPEPGDSGSDAATAQDVAQVVDSGAPGTDVVIPPPFDAGGPTLAVVIPPHFAAGGPPPLLSYGVAYRAGEVGAGG